MNEELRKDGKAISQKTFGALVGRDKACRHAAVELEMYDADLRLFGRYLHFNGYRTLKQAREQMQKFAQSIEDPYLNLKPNTGKVIDFETWKRNNT